MCYLILLNLEQPTRPFIRTDLSQKCVPSSEVQWMPQVRVGRHVTDDKGCRIEQVNTVVGQADHETIRSLFTSPRRRQCALIQKRDHLPKQTRQIRTIVSSACRRRRGISNLISLVDLLSQLIQMTLSSDLRFTVTCAMHSCVEN
jgi:hypothetical protein